MINNVKFSDKQLFKVFSAFGKKFWVRVNKSGNIDILNPQRTNPYEHFVLYFTPNNKYLWRRFTWNNSCYPLNMVGRTEYKTKDYSYKTWDITKCEFNDIDKAIDYFKKYMNNYHHINF